MIFRFDIGREKTDKYSHKRQHNLHKPFFSYKINMFKYMALKCWFEMHDLVPQTQMMNLYAKKEMT